MRAGRIITVIIGALLSVVGFAAAAGGGVLAVGHLALRDDAGYYNSPTERLQTSTAVLMTTVDISAEPGDWSLDEPLGTLRIAANAVGENPIFVGVAPAKEVEAWLAGADYERITAARGMAVPRRHRAVVGAQKVTAPGAQRFWVASVSGTAQQTLTWPIERGDWAIVLMNADAQTGIAADVSAGVETGLMLPVGLVLSGFGVFLLLVGHHCHAGRGWSFPAGDGDRGGRGPTRSRQAHIRCGSTQRWTLACPAGCGWSSGSWRSRT